MLRFGTDGVRGNADADLTPESMVALGRAVARVLQSDRVLLGRDTRESGLRIEHDLANGLAHEGATPLFLDVLPTPAIAFTAARMGAPAAIISASHNPWTDNGVKVISAQGTKLSDADEKAIEAELNACVHEGLRPAGYSGEGVLDSIEPYVEHLLGSLEGRTLRGLDVLIDCANGAASPIAATVFERAGVHVTTMHAEPDGRNINADCGSTHPQSLQRVVRERGADIGLALDGDADRVLAVDENGELVDGDQIMTMTALDLHARGVLAHNGIVVTVMSNLGLRRALHDAEIAVVETPVGDRHVVAEMRARGIGLGGEQSGHIIFAAHATTGDGLLTGLLVCDLAARSGRPLSELAAQMTRYPQVLVNVRVAARVDLERATGIQDAVGVIEGELGESGRVLVRASGTEPLVRVMVEATSIGVAAAAAARLQAVVEEEFGTFSPS